MQVLLAQGAEDDISDILSYYGEGSSRAAEFTKSLEDAVDHLRRYPDTITRRGDLTQMDVFFWLVRSHWLVLKRTPDYLLVLGVHHCAQNLAPLLKADMEPS